MKNIYLLALTMLFAGFSKAQCTSAVGNNVYTQNYTIIAGQTNDQFKLDQAINFTAYNCISSSQLKAIAMLFASDEYRYDLCVLSYHSIVDKSEIYMVYDAFSSFSYVFRLHDFVLEQRELEEEGGTTTNVPTETEPQFNFPAWNYPVITNYQGPTGCSPSIPDSDFELLAKNILIYGTDRERMVAMTVLVQGHCVSMAQYMKLGAMISMETNRLQWMKNNFQYVFDQGNYGSGVQCFQHQPYQQDWTAFCEIQLKPAEPEITCDVEEAKFKDMLSKIENEHFADDQLNVLKMLNSDHCFSTAQVKRVIAIFSFPENKLDAAEILYPKCTDRENYYQLKGSFSFPSYESDFEDMINGN